MRKAPTIRWDLHVGATRPGRPVAPEACGALGDTRACTAAGGLCGSTDSLRRGRSRQVPGGDVRCGTRQALGRSLPEPPLTARSTERTAADGPVGLRQMAFKRNPRPHMSGSGRGRPVRRWRITGGPLPVALRQSEGPEPYLLLQCSRSTGDAVLPTPPHAEAGKT